jgi:LPXTG-site transpeptidase (sortase) family protein
MRASGTAPIGSNGNTVIAGHRDLAFRALRNVQAGDIVRVESAEAKSYSYRVEGMRIVNSDDVSVLASDGRPRLTMITCYPFYYVGSAPKRFIVEARLVEAGPSATASRSTVEVPLPAVVPNAGQTPHAGRKTNRGRQFQAWPRSTTQREKKHGFWHRVLHIP